LLSIDGKLNIIPLELLTFDIPESLLISALTQDEIREKLGLVKIDKAKANQDEATINAINSLSPLVANKVMEQLTPNELRRLIGLTALAEGNTIAAPTPLGMSKELTEEEALEVFAKYGESSEGYEVIHAEAIPVNFATITITTLDKSIIDILSNDNLISNKNIAEALKVDIKTIEEAIIKLTDNGMIQIVDNERNLTKKGESIKKLDSPVEEILVRYVYDKKPGISGEKIIDTTRKFCRDLLENPKQYKRADIEAMNNELGTDVWLTRGGWYHNPKTGLTSTSCRHIWQQVLLRPKK
jgi:DNA-binding transcriptional regulator YhcF (GntR family)